MKTIKRWIEISDKQKAELIERLSLLLIWLTKEKKIQAKEIAMRIGIPGSALSHIKNKKINMVTNWKVILTAVSFKIDLPDFDSDKALGDIKQNKWDSPFFDHPLASNLYHVEIGYFNSWYGKHEIEATKQFKEDIVNAAMAGTRVHEAMEEKLLAGEIVDMLGSGEVVAKPGVQEMMEKEIGGAIEQKIFDFKTNDPPNKPVLGKSLASIIDENKTSERKLSPIFETIADAIRPSHQFNLAEHIPKESEDTKVGNHLNLIKGLKERKAEIQGLILVHESEMEKHKLSLDSLNNELSSIAKLLKLYGK